MIFFVDPAWRRGALGHTPLLQPFWGNPFDSERVPFHHALLERHGFDTRYYSITGDLHEADAILMPYSHNVALMQAPDLLVACIAASAQSGKPLLIDGLGDIEHPMDIPNAYILRYGGYRFLRTGNEIIVPPYAEDLLEVYCDSVLQIRTKNAHTPVVGFAGWVDLTFKQTMRTLVKEIPTRLYALVDQRYKACKKGIFFRRQSISVLTQSDKVDSNIVLRSSYSGHSGTAIGTLSQLRKEYVETMLHSDYCLDVRGDANASTRLGEILSLGRIPVIVDTERNFPFSDELDYKTFSIIVDFRDIQQLPQKIAEFHSQVTPEQFLQMQQRAREVYVSHFRTDALMEYIVKNLKILCKTSQ